MSYAIAGFGKMGQALAHAFARKNIDVNVASHRPPEALAPRARAIGPMVVARSAAARAGFLERLFDRFTGFTGALLNPAN